MEVILGLLVSGMIIGCLNLVIMVLGAITYLTYCYVEDKPIEARNVVLDFIMCRVLKQEKFERWSKVMYGNRCSSKQWTKGQCIVILTLVGFTLPTAIYLVVILWPFFLSAATVFGIIFSFRCLRRYTKHKKKLGG